MKLPINRKLLHVILECLKYIIGAILGYLAS